MNKLTCLLVCCLVCFSVASCTQKDDSEEAATQSEEVVTEAEEVVAEVDVSEDAAVGIWEITEWLADDVDQMAMWRIGNLTVEFRVDGSLETQLVYDNGDKRGTKGMWKRSGDQMEIHISGGGETEGDEPFERTREFTIDEMTEDAFTIWV